MAVGAEGPLTAELGEENLTWPAMLNAGRPAGIEWYITEPEQAAGTGADCA
jgi:hypothetical protein